MDGNTGNGGDGNMNNDQLYHLLQSFMATPNAQGLELAGQNPHPPTLFQVDLPYIFPFYHLTLYVVLFVFAKINTEFTQSSWAISSISLCSTLVTGTYYFITERTFFLTS